ncbi:TPA: hypothetical protein RG892_000326 [Pseudomonas aeruginosa]|nr:hypothetical protein [Pseudomonas aeruginosa]
MLPIKSRLQEVILNAQPLLGVVDDIYKGYEEVGVFFSNFDRVITQLPIDKDILNHLPRGEAKTEDFFFLHTIYQEQNKGAIHGFGEGYSGNIRFRIKIVRNTKGVIAGLTVGTLGWGMKDLERDFKNKHLLHGGVDYKDELLGKVVRHIELVKLFYVEDF